MATKADQLTLILNRLEAGKYTEDQKQQLLFVDVDGKHVRLSDPQAMEKLKQRIAASPE